MSGQRGLRWTQRPIAFPWGRAGLNTFGLAPTAGLACCAVVAALLGQAEIGIASVGVAVLLALPNLTGRVRRVSGLADRDGLVNAIDLALRSSSRQGQATGVLVVEIDNFRQIEERFDLRTVDHILRTSGDRLLSVLRESDHAARLDGPSFAVGLSPVRRLDLEAAIQLSTRIQHALTEPIPVGGMNVYVTASVGFCLGNRIPSPSGERLLHAATAALIEAQRYSPGAVRSYTTAMQNRIVGRGELADQVAQALANGDIQAYFQPQVSTRTGEISGFETLARWHHPTRGLIPPIEFLPALEQAGQMAALGTAMVRDALAALRRWDDRGLDIPQIGVNFSTEELRDPSLVDRISVALDLQKLAPDRLVIEVLETVVANHADDIILRNLAALARLGCKLDLDDFGTGHASITSIRRFAIERIKIDRSFVTRIDADTEQQKMVAAILTMAERLGLDTLAEGVETPEERSMLAELGCGHIQGFGIARPMAGADTDRWIADYRQRNSALVPFRRRPGTSRRV